MSIITKPYKLSVWEDKLINGILTESKICDIGTNDMTSQNQAFELNFVRNVNGQKKLSFKMYKQYIDNITGEKTLNPFAGLLKNETKVKLWYEDKWHDFVIKNISENSANYLCTYQLQDALVQELSKNGFGITLDESLMNNVGTAKELAQYTLKETDWGVDSEVFVQTVEEALVYITLPAGTKAIHLKDQAKDANGEYSTGVTEEEFTFGTSATVLAFYSSCKNKPHRFQFIYSPKGYDKTTDGSYIISRKDDRTIIEKDCQYYIDFYSENIYVDPSDEGVKSNIRNLGLWLPIGFDEGTCGVQKNSFGTVVETDSMLSSWYRGKRYGFAQQAVYVPVLEKYCQKFKRNENIGKEANWKVLKAGGGEDGGITGTAIWHEEANAYEIEGTKNSNYSGYYLNYNYNSKDTYIIDYKLKVIDGTLTTIGGHNAAFSASTKFQVNIGNEVIVPTDDRSLVNINIEPGASIEVHAEYSSYNPAASQPYIFIQPNRGSSVSVSYEITELKTTIKGNYLGYTDSEFISPTFVQNYITNYNFESSSGWYATAEKQKNSSTKPSVESVCGRFNNNKFVSLMEDYQKGTYDENNSYDGYMKVSCYDGTQFILNSGIKDNRTTIKNMPENEEWVLDYQIMDSVGNKTTNFDFELSEYVYNTLTGGYDLKTDSIIFETRDATIKEENKNSDYTRKIFTVKANRYQGEDAFVKKSKVFLKIKPKSVNTTIEDNITIPQSWYIKKIALYRKSLGTDGNIIIPDYEETESKSAEAFVESGVLENRYHFFSDWEVSSENPNAINNKAELSTFVRNSLDYNVFIPVYNNGAEKVRTVTAKESNYFNILQSIAETFEAWLELIITRDENGSGAIIGKKIKFKNYAGGTNYAPFRYGVNLKDIQRTYDSKNITTKLIVKTNSNELAEGGFCTIQKAGANPTGENYIYDFQYYQNQGIMNVEDYLNTVYYIEDAAGEDAEFWDNEVTLASKENTNLNGYYPRIKRINEAIIPINDEMIGLQSELVQKKATKEAADATVEASINGIEQTREDFYALTGVYPEDAQDTSIIEVRTPQDENIWGEKIPAVIVPKEEWWHIDGPITIIGLKVFGKIGLYGYEKTCSPKIVPSQNATLKGNWGGQELVKAGAWDGIYLEEAWDNAREYTLTYTLQGIEELNPSFEWSGKVNIIGGHQSGFSNYKITVKNEAGTTLIDKNSADSTIFDLGKSLEKDEKIYVTVKAKCTNPDEASWWIQPNRSLDRITACVIDDIQLTKTMLPEENTAEDDREANFALNTEVKVANNSNYIPRTYQMKVKIPAKASLVEFEQVISSVDLNRTDVAKYITQYVTYIEQNKTSSVESARIAPEIRELEQAIKLKEQTRDRYLEYKRRLNELFFKKYSRFITEGTWISEEYTDHDKYYADAQSVLYNSCYPQVAYNINVLFLSKLPGYELFQFNLGDTTYVIDNDFFGIDKKQEVIITEISEVLDDPSKDKIKVQTFKTQFQELFQKITATVQQTQYSTGAYERNNALFEAGVQKQGEFLQDILNKADTYLKAGATVTEDSQGVLVTNKSDPKRQLRLTGGAILLSAEHPETKEQVWRTGLTNEGISADLITAGRLDAGAVQIMSGDEPVFRWDAYGISAYDATWTTANEISAISGVNSKKFVRFDKNGIYGINNASGIDGQSWHPRNIDEIDENATFALTWEGLKVTKKYNIGTEEKISTARIGNCDDENGSTIIRVNNGIEDTLKVTSNGDVSIAGHIEATSGRIGPVEIQHENEINLIKFANNLSYWSPSNGGELTYDESNKAFCLNNKGEKNETFLFYDDIIYLDENKTYIISLEAKYLRANDINYSAYIGDVYLLGPDKKNVNAIRIEDRPEDFKSYNKSFQPIKSGYHQLRIDNNNFPKGGEASTTGVESKLYVRNIKLIEEGTPGALVLWDGTPGIEENLIFKVGKKAGGGYEAFIKGHIVATSGQIGNMLIEGANSIENQINTAQSTANGAQTTANSAYTLASSAVQTVSTNNNFSWQFSPSKGFYMYNGIQNPNNIVLGVYKPEGGEAYQAYIKGEIIAEKGTIGGWSANKTSLYSGDFILDSGNISTSHGNLRMSAGGEITNPDILQTKVGNTSVTVKANEGSGTTFIRIPNDEILVSCEISSLNDTINYECDYKSDLRMLELKVMPLALSMDSRSFDVKYSYTYYPSSTDVDIISSKFFVTDRGYIQAQSGRIGLWNISSSGALYSTYTEGNYNYQVFLYADHIRIDRWATNGGSAPPIIKYWHSI